MKMSIARVAPLTVLLGGCNGCGPEPRDEGQDEDERWEHPPGSESGDGRADPLWVVYLDQGRLELVRVVRPASWSTFARLSSSRLVCAPAPDGCRLKD
ncbi:MAG: hypothetical protein JRI68_04195 [Deltaproteobacteria bacterium]|nr:hypothetical protein [Deltaproteobacteria bacterium]